MGPLKAQLAVIAKSVLPIFIVMCLLELAMGFLGLQGVVDLFVGSVMVMAGLLLFLTGINSAIIPLARMIGSQLPLKTSLSVVVMLAFFLGLVINAADPAVRILADHVDSFVPGESPSPNQLILIIASGIGGFILIALVRIILNIPLAIIYAAGYGSVLILSFFVPDQFIPLAFDSGGIATGPLTVPFILAFGIGFVSVLGKTSDESFGILGLAALGPILGVMVMGVLWI